MKWDSKLNDYQTEGSNSNGDALNGHYPNEGKKLTQQTRKQRKKTITLLKQHEYKRNKKKRKGKESDKLKGTEYKRPRVLYEACLPPSPVPRANGLAQHVLSLISSPVFAREPPGLKEEKKKEHTRMHILAGFCTTNYVLWRCCWTGWNKGRDEGERCMQQGLSKRREREKEASRQTQDWRERDEWMPPQH